MIKKICYFAACLATIPILLLTSCSSSNIAKNANKKSNTKDLTDKTFSTSTSGKNGPLPSLLKVDHLHRYALKARRIKTLSKDGNRRWVVELFGDDQLLAQWPAVSGLASKQKADRRWSPGNGAPLPIGEYQLGQPEPSGQDIWLNLQPSFQTDRSGLGIHHCDPGNGCLCIPNRSDLEALASWVKATGIKNLTVMN